MGPGLLAGHGEGSWRVARLQGMAWEAGVLRGPGISARQLQGTFKAATARQAWRDGPEGLAARGIRACSRQLRCTGWSWARQMEA